MASLQPSPSSPIASPEPSPNILTPPTSPPETPSSPLHIEDVPLLETSSNPLVVVDLSCDDITPQSEPVLIKKLPKSAPDTHYVHSMEPSSLGASYDNQPLSSPSSFPGPEPLSKSCPLVNSEVSTGNALQSSSPVVEDKIESPETVTASTEISQSLPVSAEVDQLMSNYSLNQSAPEPGHEKLDASSSPPLSVQPERTPIVPIMFGFNDSMTGSPEKSRNPSSVPHSQSFSTLPPYLALQSHHKSQQHSPEGSPLASMPPASFSAASFVTSSPSYPTSLTRSSSSYFNRGHNRSASAVNLPSPTPEMSNTSTLSFFCQRYIF